MDGRSYSQLHSSDSMKRLLGVDQEFWCVKQSMQSLPCASDRLNYTEESRKLCSVTSLTLHGSVSQIRSPSRASGELKEQSPHHSFRSHSGTTTPNKSSPERFLFIDSEDSDFEVVNHVNTNQNNCSVTQPTPHCQQYRGIPHKGKRLRVSVCSSPDGEEQRARSSGSGSSLDEGAATDNADSLRSGAPLPLHGHKHRGVKATKLCHYAKTTSPSSVNTSHNDHKSNNRSLVVSISLSSLPTTSSEVTTTPLPVSCTKPRKPTALSHFATKKRPLSRSPSFTSDSPPSLSSLPSNNYELVKKEKKKGTTRGGGKVGRPPIGSKRPRGRPRLPRGRPRLSAIVQNRDQSKLPVPSDETSSKTEFCGNVDNVTSRGGVALLDPSLMGSGLELLPSIFEDDELSIGSSNTTTSSTNSIVVSNRRKATVLHRRGGGGKRGARGGHSMLRINSNFSLESLFSYCPPTLTVRDGELVPEQSLSVKNFDQFSLPSSHPIDRWSLGQPVRGRWMGSGAAPKTRRPRKTRPTTEV